MERSTRTGMGTVMLLAAAVIVILTLVFRGPLWRPHLGTEQQSRENASASKETSLHPLAAPTLPVAAASPVSATTGQRPGAADHRPEAEDPAASIGNKRLQQAATTPSTSELDPEPSRAFSERDPWAATRCVYVYTPDPSEPTRWKIENGCDAPVGVTLGPNRSVLLPAPAQRPVTLEEQTVHADRVRYKACFIASSQGRALLAAPTEERSSPAWREQFESVRVSDGCLLRLQSGGH